MRPPNKNPGFTRREFLHSASAPFAAAALSSVLRIDDPKAAQSKLGIASTSFWSTISEAGSRGLARDSCELLEKCNALGAGGIQTQLGGDLAKLRARSEQLGMWVEGMVSVPRNGDAAAFERSLIDAKAAGATVVRSGLLSGRRYETFTKLADWKKWVDQSHEAIKLVLPFLERHKITLAIENHKDWTLEEMQRLLRTYSSEYLGVCLDFGNNIALLDDPTETVEALAPYARSTHVKDMAVRPYADGFLLSEVPLGAGILDLPRMMSVLQKANPRLRFSLEMITRDPLKVPCLTPQYWAVFPERNGKFLARTLKMVQEHSNAALPEVTGLAKAEWTRVEDENIKLCFQYVKEKRLLS
jgi:3-oxoisoapionate decarboxylase